MSTEPEKEIINLRADLAAERAAHEQKSALIYKLMCAMRRKDKSLPTVDEVIDWNSKRYAEMERAEKERDAVQAKVERLRAEITGAIDLAAGEIATERLAGNIVKQTYWSGELTALRRMEQALTDAPPPVAKETP